MSAISSKFGSVIRAVSLAALVLLLAGPMFDAASAHAAMAHQNTADDEGGMSDRGTDDGDVIVPPGPGNQSPSEDETEQDARPEPPDFGGCIFEKRDLGLLV